MRTGIPPFSLIVVSDNISDQAKLPNLYAPSTNEAGQYSIRWATILFPRLARGGKNVFASKRAVSVALVTPYGATKSNYVALSKDHKLDPKGRVTAGSVGHDRIQQGKSSASIGESIRAWYALPAGDFERIDVDIDIVDDRFYIFPLKCKYANSSKVKEIAKIERPLTFTVDYVSGFWRKQLREVDKAAPGIVSWCLEEICRIVKEP